MKSTLTENEISDLVKKQLEYYIPDGYVVKDNEHWKESIAVALKRCDNCFRHVLLPGYRADRGGVFHICIVISMLRFFIF